MRCPQTRINRAVGFSTIDNLIHFVDREAPPTRRCILPAMKPKLVLPILNAAIAFCLTARSAKRRLVLGTLASICVMGLALVACRKYDRFESLKDPNPGVRQRAVVALDPYPSHGTIDPAAVEPLIAVLKNDPDADIRWQAAFALSRSRDSRVVEPLVAALKDTESVVRSAAASALGTIGDPRVIEPLIATLKDSDPKVRSSAASALGDIKDPRVVEPLIAALKDMDAEVRRAAVWALGEIKDPRAADALMLALKDPDCDIRIYAAKELPDDLLFKGLNKFGSREIAECFLNSRRANERVHLAASRWATDHGYHEE